MQGFKLNRDSKRGPCWSFSPCLSVWWPTDVMGKNKHWPFGGKKKRFYLLLTPGNVILCYGYHDAIRYANICVTSRVLNPGYPYLRDTSGAQCQSRIYTGSKLVVTVSADVLALTLPSRQEVQRCLQFGHVLFQVSLTICRLLSVRLR